MDTHKKGHTSLAKQHATSNRLGPMTECIERYHSAVSDKRSAEHAMREAKLDMEEWCLDHPQQALSEGYLTVTMPLKRPRK